MKKYFSLLIISIVSGICTPCYGFYIKTRAGLGELKSKKLSTFSDTNGRTPTWEQFARNYGGGDPNLYYEDENLVFDDSSSVAHSDNCSSKFCSKNHYNLSIALGEHFHISNIDTGVLGIEFEIIGGCASFKGERDLVTCTSDLGGANVGQVRLHDDFQIMRPDFIYIDYEAATRSANIQPIYITKQKIFGSQVNFYWEQYISDWLSAYIGGGVGCAYVGTKLRIDRHFGVLEHADVDNPGGADVMYRLEAWRNRGSDGSDQKTVQNLALLYNFTLCLCAEKFNTLFEVGYRYIGLREINRAKFNDFSIKNLANLHSNQIYFGIGRKF